MAAKPRIRVPANSRPSASASAAGARFVGTTRAHDAASTTSQELGNWLPALYDANDEALGGRDRIVARSRDLVRNDPTAQGGIEKRVNATVGAEMWVSARPNWRALGISQEAGEDFARQCENAFNEWANDPWFYCDVEGTLKFSGLVELAFTHVAREDEALAVLYAYEPGPFQKYATQVRIVDPDLLCNPDNRPDERRLRGGVEFTTNGRPIAYHFRLEHPNATITDMRRQERWTRVSRYTRAGRPQVVHYYGKSRAGMIRGVSKLAAGLKSFKQLSRYTSAEISAQLLAAMMPLFITSKSPNTVAEALAPADDGDAASYADQRAEFHESSKLTFNGVRIPALFDHESIESVDTRRQAADYSKFQAAMLRTLAPLFNMTYEQLSNDWGNVNYSSARAALIEIWRTIDADRARFAARFLDPIYQAVIWEAVARGFITLPAGAPDFVRNLAHYTRCRWIGPGRGWVDPVKEAQAAAMRTGSYLTDLETEAAEQGQDVYENMEVAARIRREQQRLGLPAPDTGNMVDGDPSDDVPGRAAPETQSQDQQA